MSAVLENTAEELEDLIGATIENAWIEKDDDLDTGRVRMRVRFRKGLQVNLSHAGEYEIWQDEEGNGPGFIAFVGEPA